MWVKIEVEANDKDIIYIPQHVCRNMNKRVNVVFGKRVVKAEVISVKGPKTSAGSSFDQPLSIKISDKLASELKFVESLTYAMKCDDRRIKIGPVIGLLLGPHDYSYSPEHMEKYSDRFGIYDKIGGLVYAFSANAIDWENESVYGLYYEYSEAKWKFGNFPLPSVIYRRDFHTDHETEKKLIDITSGKMFNSWRFSKFDLNNYVMRNKDLAKHLPSTEYCSSYEQLKKFMDTHGNIILKPTDLSRGRGICIVTAAGEQNIIYDYREKKEKIIEVKDTEALQEFFENNKGLFNNYVIQKHLVLAKIDGSPFDIRVVVQKEKPSKWKITGIECRVAGQKILLTNISRGGYALTIDEALEKVFPGQSEVHERLKKRLFDLCFKLCHYLDKMGPHFGEFGMDIALDEEGNLWIIEVNVFPSFKGFKTMDKSIYLDIRHTPLLYAAQLAGF